MPSLIYDSFFDDVNNGRINPAADAFRAMLVTNAYTESKGGHTKRADVTGEVTGPGYVAGGQPVVVTVTKDAALHRIDVNFAGVGWPASTLTGRKCVVYKYRGGAPIADELAFVVDFGADVSSTAATFSVSGSVIRTQN